ncbi:diacylglycerol kinase A-like [Macrobrachium rosenbergii]|uniref:diacylglycerol kinase A-like n=1 Tax=Macrobrachium rosenbergii TaxID=79674 RepID=UPI0034D72E4B
MQCKVVQESSFSPDDSDMAYSSSPFHQSSNILLPHQIGSVDSTCSSWPGHVWRNEPPSSKYWLESDLNNNKNSSNGFSYGRERVSVSSECSDISISTDDFCMNSDTEESYNSDSSTSSEASSSSTTAGREITQAPLTGYMHEHTNNNNNNNSFGQLSNDTNNNSKSNYKANASPGATKNNKNNAKTSDKAKSRLLDDEGYIRRAACVCLDETESKVLLVSSKKDPCSWLVPGGGMEAGEEMATAAIREAWEEAGVQGHITKYLGLFETNHQNGLKKHRTAVFVVSVKQVMADYPEAYLGRVRQWFTLEDALLHLARTRPLQSAYLQLLLVSRLKVTTS